jgi:hypothetical protein
MLYLLLPWALLHLVLRAQQPAYLHHVGGGSAFSRPDSFPGDLDSRRFGGRDTSGGTTHQGIAGATSGIPFCCRTAPTGRQTGVDLCGRASLLSAHDFAGLRAPSSAASIR